MKRNLSTKIALSIMLAGVFTGSACVMPGLLHAEKRITDGVYEEDVFDRQQSVNSKEKVCCQMPGLLLKAAN